MEVVSESITNYCSSVLSILRLGVHVISQKAGDRSHLHMSTFLTQCCYVNHESWI